ncbi:MAG: hypothetical protein HYY41_00315 [Chloroflexi bacterium]|nr:hypothetical protein [Chloroflexota bacterium]MBI2979271.1 hypothetical protein [Chloroflexota bacterium]
MGKNIKTVIRCPNHKKVMVFDDTGKPIPEYQGRYEELKETILKDAPADAKFGYYFDYGPELREVPREEW